VALWVMLNVFHKVWANLINMLINAAASFYSNNK